MKLKNGMTGLIALGAIACAGASSVSFGAVVLNNGQQVSLSSLLASGNDRQFIVGDKLFTIESYSSTTFDASNYAVVGFIAGGPGPDGLTNVGFDLIGPFVDSSPGDQVVHEMNLQYTVQIQDQFVAAGYRIAGSFLSFNGSATGDGSFSRVDQSVFDFNLNTMLGGSSVVAIAGNPTQPQDGVTFANPVVMLELNTNIKMLAIQADGTATASFVRQEFSQLIPAPSAMALFGVFGLFAVRRRD
jgi:hypothetical protein